ncbi:MAG: hypothetical protein J7647_05705 [Cyanobacteria bacterium SBLK]|nr:hypothetical protein [Cyanobacteria bacterium SBLK]
MAIAILNGIGKDRGGAIAAIVPLESSESNLNFQSAIACLKSLKRKSMAIATSLLIIRQRKFSRFLLRFS